MAHPLTADPGDTVRFYVVDAGPSLTTAFHVVGTILNTAYVDGDMNPAHALNGVQTVDVPAGGGGVFDVQIDERGALPLRQPFLRERRHGPGRAPEGRQPARNDVSLITTPRVGAAARRRPSGAADQDSSSSPLTSA